MTPRTPSSTLTHPPFPATPRLRPCRSRDVPAGIGVFSLAGRDVVVRSWSGAAGRGWAVHIPADGWEGAVPLAIEPCGIVRGTEIQIMLPAAWEDRKRAV